MQDNTLLHYAMPTLATLPKKQTSKKTAFRHQINRMASKLVRYFPIEYLSSIIERELYENRNQCSNKGNLWEAIKTAVNIVKLKLGKLT